jgi:hypothetical protein
MSKKHRDDPTNRSQDTGNRTEKLSKLRVHRRRFLQALGLLGGGALTSAGSMVAAARASASAPGNVFDISLPASYDVDEPNEVITVDLDGRPAVPVEFHTVSRVRLDPTSDPDVASVRLVSLQMTSVDPNPLDVVGIDAGVVSAAVAADTVIGQLNLATGTLTEHAFPITISFERNRSPFTTDVQPTRAVVSETAPDPEEAEKEPEKKCFNDNDVDLGIDTPLDTGQAFGTISFGLIPASTTIGSSPSQPVNQ